MALFIDFPKQEMKETWKDTVGTIRSGRQDPHNNNLPYSLPAWRFTADTAEICQTLADKYGGEVSEWVTKGSDRFEVLTDTEALDVQLLTFGSEMIQWGQRKPLRVCDGQTRTDENHAGEPCKCLADFPVLWDRKTAAKEGEACKPNLQATMTLVDFPDLGTFKWQSSAWMVAEDYANWLEEIAASKGNVTMTIEGYTTKAGQPRQKTLFDLIESVKATA